MEELFRKESVQHRNDRWLGEVSLVKPITLSSISLVIFSLLVLGVIWSFNAEYSSVSSFQGVILPSNGLVEVIATSDGKVIEIQKDIGNEVFEGETIIRIGNEVNPTNGTNLVEQNANLNRLIHEINKTIDDLIVTNDFIKKNLDTQISSLDRSSNNLKRQLPILEEKIKSANDRFKVFESAANSGVIAEINLINYEIELLNLDQEKIRLESSIEDSYRNKKQLEEKKLTLNSLQQKEQVNLQSQKNTVIDKLRQLDIYQDYKVIAPSNGVLKYRSISLNEYVSKGESLFLIEPKDPNYIVETFVDELTHKKIKEGQLINIRFDAFPYQVYGEFEGSILEIAIIPEFPERNDEVNTEYKYKVLIAIPLSFMDLEGINHPLNSNMKLSTLFNTESRTIIEWLFPSIKKIMS